MGTREDINAVLPVLTVVLTVQEVSDFYPNRGKSQLGRVYIEVTGPRITTATAVRTDRPQPAESRRAIEP
jgi:hypothetical protein